MTVNHWVPGSSPGRGAKFKNPASALGFLLPAGLSPGTASQVIRFAHPCGAALKRVLLTQSSPGRGAKFKNPASALGFFIACWTLTRDCVPGYSLRSPLRGRAEARSADAVESRSRSQIQQPSQRAGFFIACWALTRDYASSHTEVEDSACSRLTRPPEYPSADATSLARASNSTSRKSRQARSRPYPSARRCDAAACPVPSRCPRPPRA